MIHNGRLSVSATLVAGLALLIGFSGCSGGQQSTGPVSGKVTHDGQPVEGGSVTFAPIAGDSGAAGKPASGEVKSDGTYTLSTYGTGDGAVIGRHRVMYSPPSVGAESGDGDSGAHAETPPPSPYVGLSPKNPEVEVKGGTNVINIELVKGAGASDAAATSN